MTFTQLYLFTVVLPNAASVMAGLSFFFYAGFLTMLIAAFPIADIKSEADGKKCMSWAKRFLISGIVTSLVTIGLPTENQLYMVAGGYVATNTKDVSKLPDNVVKAANAWLEKAATLAEEKTKEKKSNQ